MSTIAPPPAANAVLTAAAATAGVAAENLDERMERIRRRNEELEQKHREAEADRLAALRNNAMVVTTRPVHAAGAGDGDDDDDDWPRGHRYDTHEFAYETADKSETPSAATGDASSAAAAGATTTAAVASLDGNKRSGVDALSQKGPGGRDYKKFAEGEGPPPDPSFNFLADAERDGKQRRAAAAERAAKAANNGERNKDWRNQPGSAATTAADGAADNATASQAQRSRGGLNGSFKLAGGQRGHNNNNSSSNSNNSTANNGPRGRAAQRTSGTDDATPAGAGGRNGGGGSGNNEFNQWKTERERIDEARIGRQRTGDGKWRREWDNEKFGGGGNVEPTTPCMLAGQIDNIHIGGGGGVAPITTAAAGRHITVVNNSTNNNANINSVEKRGNVTVLVNKDGEVKSVKLVTNRVIGTGRVGPRQLPATSVAVASAESAFPIKNFTPRTQHASQGPPQPHPYYQQNNPLQMQQQQQQQHHLHHHQMPPFVQPTPAVFYDQPPPPLLPLAANLPPAARQFLEARPKLQDRLARHRQPVANANDAATGI